MPIILASDKTPVTRHTGGLEMHPIFLTIGNIASNICMKATTHAWSCVTFMPVISHVKQMTGREHRDIQCTIMPMISGAAPDSFVSAIRALIDFIYTVQDPIHTSSSILRMVAALEEFHNEKQAILDAEAWRGKSGPIMYFNIPKLELLQSFAQAIKNNGNLIQFTEDVIERLLITVCKQTFQRTSHQKDFIEQCTRILDHQEKVRMFDLYTILREIDEGFINNIISAENHEVALASVDHEVIDTDPQYAWISKIRPLEMHVQGPRPVRNHFLHGLLSEDMSIAYHLTSIPDKHVMTINVRLIFIRPIYLLPYLLLMLRYLIEF